MNEVIKDKIRKLIAHGESAKKIGNKGESDLYLSTARKLMRKHKITKKSLHEKPRFDVGGMFVCSCGTSVEMDVRGGDENTVHLMNVLLSMHMKDGHQLTKIG